MKVSRDSGRRESVDRPRGTAPRIVGVTRIDEFAEGYLGLPVERTRVIPDIGAVFGEYTYLATEIAWGTVAFWLLYRVDAVGQAGRTIVVLYPIAYLWDWYTLRIGVFAIPLRTGIELLGIPIEEHVFMVVVPALVIGMHENLRRRDERDAD